MKKIIKFVLIVLVIAFVTIQFFRPTKNAGEELAANQITAVNQVPQDVQQLLKVSCYDCHSNTTIYPWYSKMQPIAWFLNNHIIEGKKEVNFSEFSTYGTYRRYKKFKEIEKQVKDDEMPIFSYTLIHRDAALSAEQKTALINWAVASRKEMEATLPADSLKKPQ